MKYFLIFNFVFLLCVSLQAAQYDSALAPYPYLRTEPYNASVEAILKKVEGNAPADGDFSATVVWMCVTEKKLDLNRHRYGPFSIKSCPNWHTPVSSGYWKSGTYNIKNMAGDFLLEKPEDDLSSSDWWQKEGETIYARAFSVDWHDTWRFHEDALEADMLGYCEGLGLLLWAFQPGEYLRRAENLDAGSDRKVNGKTCKTLVATPNWIKTPLFLENRTHYPFNHSTIISWANLKPVITYFVDPDLNAIIAAEFVYYNCHRSGPKDWNTVAKPSGLVIFCTAEELSKTETGTWYPTKVQSEVYTGEVLVRQTSMSIKLGDVPASIGLKSLTAEKRMIDPWPMYRTYVYREILRNGSVNHADLLGLARSLCYENPSEDAETALFEAVSGLEKDFSLKPSTLGGIDWELGFAVYELFWRYNSDELNMFWQKIPRTTTWTSILGRAVNLYQKYRPKESEKINGLLMEYKTNFEAEQLKQMENDCLETYRDQLAKDIQSSKTKNDLEHAAYLEKFLNEVETKIAEEK